MNTEADKPRGDRIFNRKKEEDEGARRKQKNQRKRGKVSQIWFVFLVCFWNRSLRMDGPHCCLRLARHIWMTFNKYERTTVSPFSFLSFPFFSFLPCPFFVANPKLNLSPALSALFLFKFLRRARNPPSLVRFRVQIICLSALRSRHFYPFLSYFSILLVVVIPSSFVKFSWSLLF